MITICVTAVLIVALVCATICFIQREKAHAALDLSEAQLLEDVHIRALNVFNRYLDEYNKACADGSFYTNGKDLYTAIEDIVKMTNKYYKQQKD